MWFTFSLITVLAWGIDNVFQKCGTNENDKTSHLKMVVWVGAVMGTHAICYMIFNSYSFDFVNILVYFPVSLLYIASMAFSYVGLRYMELSIVSPVCNTSGAVTALLCYFVLKQDMTAVQLAGVILVCIGIVLVSVFEKEKESDIIDKLGKKPERKYMYGAGALIFPLLYCLLDGVGSFADAYYLTEVMGEEDALLAYEFTFLIAAIVCFIYVKFVKKSKFVKREEGHKFAAGVCEMIGQYTYVYAMADNAVTAAPMIASYCVISVLLSRIFLKEKLNKKQYFAIFIVFIAIALLGIE